MAFSKLKRLTTNHTTLGLSGNVSSYVALVQVTADAELAAGARSDGRDIRPHTDDTFATPLPFWLLHYTTGTLYMLVLVTSLLAATDTEIVLGYGDPALSSDGSSSAAFPSSWKALLSFGDGTTLSLSDLTSNANHATQAGTNNVTASTGISKGAAFFEPSFDDNRFLTLANNGSSMSGNGSHTMLVTARLNQNPFNSQWQFAVKDAGGSTWGLAFGITHNIGPDTYQWFGICVTTTPSPTGYEARDPATLPGSPTDTSWRRFAVRFDNSGQKVSIWKNGVKVGETATGTTLRTGGPTKLGSTFDGASGRHWGDLDDFALVAAGLSDDYLTADGLNFVDPASFWAVSAEEAAGGSALAKILQQVAG